ncbi:MAG: response regulator [Elusimicrobia bacterium]|nr:response regulator [Elusimicrobiota bacterium]
MPTRILCADADPDTLHLVSLKLTRMGYLVTPAGDGREALTRIRAEKPDLIIMDYFLPVIAGDEVCRTVKSDPAPKGIPIILLSASAAMLPPEVCAAIPCEERLNKPFDMPVLLEKVSRLAPLS